MPSIGAARREVVRHVVRGVVEAYEESERALAEGRATFFCEDEQCDTLVDILEQRVADARLTVIRAILCITPEGQPEHPGHRAEMRHLHARGVSLEGRLYLVAADQDVARERGLHLGDESGDPSGPPVMTLTVLDRSAVEDLDDAPVLDLAPADEG
jgi:hypothetical protein